MPDWEERLLAVLRADTDDLTELARIAGADAKTFYRGANFRNADLRGEDLLAFDLAGAQLQEATLSAVDAELQDLWRTLEGLQEGSIQWAMTLTAVADLYFMQVAKKQRPFGIGTPERGKTLLQEKPRHL